METSEWPSGLVRSTRVLTKDEMDVFIKAFKENPAQFDKVCTCRKCMPWRQLGPAS